MEKIDAVISWVDGQDDLYQQKLQAFCQQQGYERTQVIEPTRYRQCDEIYYCLFGLMRFAPWLSNIYIITNQQTPKAVHQFHGSAFGNKIKIIDQNELLQQNHIETPIFNSISIEWLMWRIPGLSNRFLYLNDDFFIMRPVTPQDFFRDNCSVLNGHWRTQAAQKWAYRIKKSIRTTLKMPPPVLKTNPHRHWQEQSAQLAGFSKHCYSLAHAPYPLVKETFAAFIAQNESFFVKHASYPFRHPDQISSIPLMIHLDIQAHRTIHNTTQKTEIIHGAAHSNRKTRARLHHVKRDPNIAFLCMQSVDETSDAFRLELQQYLEHWC